METSQTYEILIGMLMPVVMSIVLQMHWKTTTKSLVFFAACMVAAAVVVMVEGGTQSDLAATFATIFVMAVATYKGLWKPTGMAERVTTATDVARFRNAA